MIDVIELTQALIQHPSITPEDAGCQALLQQHIESLGFSCVQLPCNRVSNLWAQRGTAQPLIVFAGHTDVVATGDPQLWQHPPFSGVVVDDKLYGRGAADMKSALAAMIVAIERFIHDFPTHAGSIGLLITSGEEGDDYQDGTPHVLHYLAQQKIIIDQCIIGEPSSTTQLGDTIKVGRRGSLCGDLTIHGIQGHAAYPHLADNSLHTAANAIQRLTAETWDHGNTYFPATSLQFTHAQTSTDSYNVIPGNTTLKCNFRYSSSVTATELQQRVAYILKEYNVKHSIKWRLSGEPFLTEPGALTTAVDASISHVCGYTPEHATTGGTSDGRFIAPYGIPVVEIGVCNATIHQINEHASVTQIRQLTDVYYHILRELLLTLS